MINSKHSHSIFLVFFILFILMSHAIQLNGQDRIITTEGNWTKKLSRAKYKFEITLEVRGRAAVGKIEWTLVKAPAAFIHYYIGKKGKKAIEYIKGTTTDGVNFQMRGYRKNDPHSIISVDSYKFAISNSAIKGSTKAGGNWEGRIKGIVTTDEIPKVEEKKEEVVANNKVGQRKSSKSKDSEKTVDYTRRDEDHPYEWKNRELPKDFIIGKWHGYKGSETLKFNVDNTLVYTNYKGEVTKSTWSIDPSYQGKNTQTLVYPLYIGCCLESSDFVVYSNQIEDVIVIRPKYNTESRYIFIKYKEELADRGLDSLKLSRLRNYFVGTWKFNSGWGLLASTDGINLKEDGTYNTETSLGGPFTSMSGVKGRWNIYYKKTGNHKYVYLDIIRKNENWETEEIQRHAINLESFTENSFVSWRLTDAINDAHKFERIDSFKDIYNSGDRNKILFAFFGLRTAISITQGITERDASKQASGRHKQIEIWAEQDEVYRRENN